MPKVSVLIPIYNAASHLRDSMQSILDQSYMDFECLLINDGSKDESLEIMRAFTDPRIRIIQNQRNLGLSATLNLGLTEARGEYIARMDQDDLCDPDRLKIQVAYLAAHPEVAILGSRFKTFGTKLSRVVDLPLEDSEIRAALLFDSPLCHPSLLFRKSFFEKHNLQYNSERDHAEDYDLWIRAALAGAHFTNLAKPLLKYRIHPGQTTSTSTQQKTRADTVRIAYLKALGIELPPHLLAIHVKVARWDFSFLLTDELEAFKEWKKFLSESLRKNSTELARGFEQHLIHRSTTTYYEKFADSQLRRAIRTENLLNSSVLTFEQKRHFIIRSIYRTYIHPKQISES